MFCTFLLRKVLFATAACNFGASDVRKALRNWRVLYIFTSKCAFRHSGVHFFDIWTPKSASERTCIVHFYFKTCVSPQRRAIFRYRKYKKCFGADVFCTFSLRNVLFATAACNFWFLLWAATSAPAALTGLLLDWPDTRTIEKTQHFATSLTFGTDVSSFFWLSRYCIFFLLTWLLYSVHIVGSFYLNFLRLYMSYISRLCLQQNSHHHQQKRIKRQQHHHLHQHQQQWQQEEQQHSNGNSKNKNKNKKKKKKKKKTKTKQIKWQT